MGAMVVEFEGHQSSLGSFGTFHGHTRHSGDFNSLPYSRKDGRRARTVRLSASAPASPPDRISVLTMTRHDAGVAFVTPPTRPVSKSAPASPTENRKSMSTSPLQTCTLPDALTESPGNLGLNQCSSFTGGSDAMSSKSSSPSTYPFTPVSITSFNLDDNAQSNTALDRPPKRRRALHDVDGPGTGHLPCKKRRLRLDFITSRLSQPYSIPATHILNRQSGEDTPLLSRFLKFAAIGAKKAGHQTELVRKAAILNRLRLNIRQTNVNGTSERMWRLPGSGVMRHGIQLVTGMAGTGAMFPGRPGAWEHVSVLRSSWRAHTRPGPYPGEAELSLKYPGTPPVPLSTAPQVAVASITMAPADPKTASLRPPPAPRLSPLRSPILVPKTSIMTPMATAEDDEESFPTMGNMSDDDIEDVYADFETLFGGNPENTANSPERDPDDHFYEEYLDELDGIGWMHQGPILDGAQTDAGAT